MTCSYRAPGLENANHYCKLAPGPHCPILWIPAKLPIEAIRTEEPCDRVPLLDTKNDSYMIFIVRTAPASLWLPHFKKAFVFANR